MLNKALISCVVLVAFVLKVPATPLEASGGSEPVATPEFEIQISGSKTCPRQQLEDYHACNCCFVLKDGRPGLYPNKKFSPDERKSLLAACNRRFGSGKKQCTACARIRLCSYYSDDSDECFKGVKGEATEFLPDETTYAMTFILFACFTDGK